MLRWRPTVPGVLVAAAVVAALASGVAVTDPTVGGAVLVGVAAAVVLGWLAPLVALGRVRAPGAVVAYRTWVPAPAGRSGGRRRRRGGRAGRAAEPVAGPVVALDGPLAVGDEVVVEVRLAAGTGLAVAWPGSRWGDAVRTGTGGAVLALPVHRRGRYRELQVELRADGPLRLARARRRVVVPLARELVVGPSPLAGVAPDGATTTVAAADAVVAVRTGGDEVRALRPYVPGDASQLVHWPTSARVGALVVRELDPPGTPGIAVVVDAPGPDRGEASAAGGAGPLDEPTDPGLEGALARAAGLCLDADARGRRVVLCGPGATAPRPVRGAVEVADALAGAHRGPSPAPPTGWDVVTVAAPPPVPSAVASGRTRTAGRTRQAAPAEPARRSPAVSPDRAVLGNGGQLAVVVLLIASVWAALVTLPTRQGNLTLQAAVVVAGLAVIGLRSVPLRRVVGAFAVGGAVVVARYGVLEPGVVTSTALGWAAATVAALALAPGAGRLGGPGPSVRPRAVPWVGAVAVAAVVCGAGLVGGPVAAGGLAVAPGVGEPPDPSDRQANDPLDFTDRLDMTDRPRLSERVVMTVAAPEAAFWRTTTYERWDGVAWERVDPGGWDAVVGGVVPPAPEDLGALRGDELRQQVRLEVPFATLLPAAASPVRVDRLPQLLHRADGTIGSAEGLGAGATYEVVSRRLPVTDAALSATDDDAVPADVRARYGASPVATDRVRELARSVTAGATNDYARVRAIEAWLGANTTYSLTAPLSPGGVDVVDHFLFESRVGWCEQIASSLVVLAREVGVPARLAVGFVPGERSGLDGRWVVRERHAHAWAEVWFPEWGWVSFDPTADVPLAGEQEPEPAPGALRDVGGALLALGVVLVAAGPVLRAVRAGAARARAAAARRRAARGSWVVAAEQALEAAGRAAGRPRGPGETATVYGAAVSEATGDPAHATTGELIDRARYSPHPVEPAEPVERSPGRSAR